MLHRPGPKNTLDRSCAAAEGEAPATRDRPDMLAKAADRTCKHSLSLPLLPPKIKFSSMKDHAFYFSTMKKPQS